MRTKKKIAEQAEYKNAQLERRLAKRRTIKKITSGKFLFLLIRCQPGYSFKGSFALDFEQTQTFFHETLPKGVNNFMDQKETQQGVESWE